MRVPVLVAAVAFGLSASRGPRASAEDAPSPAPGAPDAEGGAKPAEPPQPVLPATGAPTDGPRASFDREKQDFGVVSQNDERKTEFRLTNAGKGTLKLLDLRADCGCAAVTVDRRELQPTESLTIQVMLRSLTMSGPLRKRVIVKTNDATRPVVELGLEMEIAAGIVLVPARLHFGEVKTGDAPSATLRAQWKEGVGKAFELKSVDAPGVDITFATKRFDAPPWHGWEITGTFRKPPPVGPVGGTVVLRTDDPDHARLVAPIQAFVSGKVWVDRRKATLGIVPFGKGREIAVGARAFGEGVDLGTVTAKARGGRVETKVIPSGREWVVTIRLPESAPAGRVEDVVEVLSSIPGEPPAEIVVTGQVLEAPK